MDIPDRYYPLEPEYQAEYYDDEPRHEMQHDFVMYEAVEEAIEENEAENPHYRSSSRQEHGEHEQTHSPNLMHSEFVFKRFF